MTTSNWRPTEPPSSLWGVLGICPFDLMTSGTEYIGPNGQIPTIGSDFGVTLKVMLLLETLSWGQFYLEPFVSV